MTGAVLVFPVAGDKLSVGLSAAVWAAAPRPLPAGAGPTLRCPGTGVQIACCEALPQRRETGRIIPVGPEITGDPHPGFSKSTRFCCRKRAH